MSQLILDQESGQQQEIRAELEKNRELLEKIYESTEKTRRYIRWMKIADLIRLVVTLILILVTIVMLWSQLDTLVDVYSELL